MQYRSGDMFEEYLSPEVVAWIAGFLEGEGSFQAKHYTYKDGYTRRVARIYCVNTDFEVLQKLQEWTGVGKIYDKKTSLLGTKRTWVWQVMTQTDVLRLTTAIRPWMGTVRKTQIDKIREVLL